MKTETKNRRRRRSRSWTDKDLNMLIRFGLLGFLPAEDVIIDVHKPRRRIGSEKPKRRGRLTKAHRKKLDAELETLHGQTWPTSKLRDHLWDVIRPIAANGLAIDLALFAEAACYVCSRLGQPESLLLYQIPEAPVSPLTRKRLQLEAQSQEFLFLQWTNVFEDVWSYHLWKECMLLKYDARRKTPMDWLEPRVRSQLEKAAQDLQTTQNGVGLTTAQILDVLGSIEGCPRYGPARITIMQEYLKAMVEGDEQTLGVLTGSLENGEFYRFLLRNEHRHPDSAFRHRTAEKDGRFLQYLICPKGDSQELVGRILYYLIRLDGLANETDAPELPPAMRGIWPANLASAQPHPGRDFGKVADRFSGALGIERNVFRDIWGASYVLTLADFYRRRDPVRFRVFWAAHILKALQPEVYETYRDWVDTFGERLRSEAQSLADGERSGAYRYAVVGPIADALTGDALLNCVFHSEALGGHKMIVYRRRKKGPDYRIVNCTLAYARRRLEKVWPKSRPPVYEILKPCRGLSPEVVNAVNEQYADSEDAVDVSPGSLYAYLAVLARALFGRSVSHLLPRTVKTRCLDYRNDTQVRHLLEDLHKAFLKILRQE